MILNLSCLIKRNILENSFRLENTIYNNLIKKISNIFKNDFSVQNNLKNLPAIIKNEIKDKGYILYSKHKDITIILNSDDPHITVATISFENEPENLLNIAEGIEEKIKKKLILAYSDDFGFLSSNPLESGYMIEYKALLHLPSLYITGKIEEIKNNLNNHRTFITGINNHVIALCYGFTELTIRPFLREDKKTFTNRLKITLDNIIKLENDEFQNYISKNKKEFENIIYKSLGLIKYTKELKETDIIKHTSFILWGIKENSVKINDLKKLIKHIVYSDFKGLKKFLKNQVL